MFTEWKVTRVAFDAVSNLLGLQLRGDGAAGNDDGAVPEDDAQFLGQLGVAVRPIVTATLEALGYQDGDEVRVMKLWDKDRSPTDLAAGETRVFAVGDLTARVRLKTDGLTVEARGATLTITSSGAVQVTPAAGQDIVLNGGSLRVARETDAVTVNAALVTTLGQVATLLNTAGPVVGAPGSVTPFTGPTVGTITLGAGAPNVKA